MGIFIQQREALLQQLQVNAMDTEVSYFFFLWHHLGGGKGEGVGEIVFFYCMEGKVGESK